MTGAGMVYVFFFVKWLFAAVTGAAMGALRFTRRAAVLTTLALLELTSLGGVIVPVLSDKSLSQAPIGNILGLAAVPFASVAITAGVAAAFHWLGGRLRAALWGRGCQPPGR